MDRVCISKWFTFMFPFLSLPAQLSILETLDQSLIPGDFQKPVNCQVTMLLRMFSYLRSFSDERGGRQQSSKTNR